MEYNGYAIPFLVDNVYNLSPFDQPRWGENNDAEILNE
tara:strand:- start:35177 stop:35290 length:114 start_codon:yes stop_codon:yes gene_type:complete